MFGETEGRAAAIADLRRRMVALEGTSPTAPRDSASGDSASRGSAPRGSASGTSSPHAAGSVAHDDILAVPAPLAEVMPRRGLPRGSVVSVASSAPGRSGATSVLLALLGAPKRVWVAVVGMPDLGVLAAAEMGVDLSRLGLIPDPGPDVWQVISVLADGMDVIAVAVPERASPPPARKRVLAGRLRESGTVLMVAGRWPGADLTLTARDVRWSGTDRGYGRLRDREIDVEIGGRRSGAARGATVTLRLLAARNGVMVDGPATGHEASTNQAKAHAETG